MATAILPSTYFPLSLIAAAALCIAVNFAKLDGANGSIDDGDSSSDDVKAFCHELYGILQPNSNDGEIDAQCTRHVLEGIENALDQAQCVPFSNLCTPGKDKCCKIGAVSTLRCASYAGNDICLCTHATRVCSNGTECCTNRCTDGICECGLVNEICHLWNSATCCPPLSCQPQVPGFPGNNGLCG